APEPPAKKPSRRAMMLAAGGLVAGGGGAWLTWGRKHPPPDDSPLLTAPAPGGTAPDITLGLTGPVSGTAKELGRGMQISIETHFRFLNETAGGVHGRKLKLVTLDDGYEPARCVAAMKELLGERPVFAFVGNVGTPTAEVSLPMALEHKR